MTGADASADADADADADGSRVHEEQDGSGSASASAAAIDARLRARGTAGRYHAVAAVALAAILDSASDIAPAASTAIPALARPNGGMFT